MIRYIGSKVDLGKSAILIWWGESKNGNSEILLIYPSTKKCKVFVEHLSREI